jgi:hypothetical protein
VQILLGFQLRGVFSDGYEQLPPYARYLDGLALGLMVCVVGLLITRGPYHRIVESGEDSAHILRLVTVIANLSLFPFALALGLDVFITPGAFSEGRRAPTQELRPLPLPSLSGTDSPNAQAAYRRTGTRDDQRPIQ